MIIEERQYRIAAGRLSEYLAIYEKLGLQIQSRILGNLIGYFRSEIGELSCLVHLWGYESLTTAPSAGRNWPNSPNGKTTCGNAHR